jgi:hypothetical protein
MSTLSRIAAGLLVSCTLLAPAAQARDIYVAITGNNGWPGTSAQPYRTIKYALSQSVSGDLVHVRQGIYTESWVIVPSGVTVRSEDGLYKAKLYSGGSSGFRLEGVTNAEVDGFECYGDYAVGSYGDGLLRVYNSSNCRFKNMLVHDAPMDCDVIKIGGTGAPTTNTLIENCTVYNPSPRNGDLTGASGYQECIDCYPPDGVVIRGCWLYHTPDRKGDTLTFCKGGSKNITWENNVFGPRYGDPNGNAMTSGGGPSPAVYPACENFVARNNLFLNGSADGAFVLMGVRNAQFNNNIIWNYNGNRAAFEFYTAKIGGQINENLQFCNNIVMQTNGMPVFADRGKWTADGTNIPVVFQHDYNIYYQTAGGGDVNINAEPHSRFVSPMLTSPSAPVLGADTWASIVARFRPKFNSPAVDAALNLGALVSTDVLAVPRPIGTAYDIGAYEVLPGDANADGHVDVTDLLTLVAAFGSVSGDANYDPTCDFNVDGAVDVVDLLYLIDTFGLY